jgi:hypothetical protein
MLLAHITSEHIQTAFYAAARQGYGSFQPEVTSFLAYPASKSISIAVDPGFLVTDTWFSNPGCDDSHGFTNVYFGEALVWYMQYQGSYPQEVVPILKTFLERSYNRNWWVRGIANDELTSTDGKRYRYWANTLPTSLGSFRRFDGRETIRVSDPATEQFKVVGFHTYRGGMTNF